LPASRCEACRLFHSFVTIGGGDDVSWERVMDHWILRDDNASLVEKERVAAGGHS
jgi:hypothetical protein